MKKTLLYAFFAMASFGANAQLANGSTAPDFTAKDINGNTHTLSEYLAAGKTVIIDISATWCLPCWNYHSTNALEDLYTTYGDEGSKEVVVLFIEGDATTTNDNIHGKSGPAISRGDWTKGSPYPIIDDATIASKYKIKYFPTVYMVCPDGKTTELTQPSLAILKSSINAGCTTLTGVENNAMVNSTDIRTCAAGDTKSIAAKLRNFGSNAITSATLALKKGDEVVATKDYTGNLASLSLSSPTVTFDDVKLESGDDYSVEITAINGAKPYNGDLAKKSFDVAFAGKTSNLIRVDTYTDYYPAQSSWIIKNGAGTIVAQSRAYAAGTGTGGAGSVDANKMISETFNITDSEDLDCYSIQFKDTGADGWGVRLTDFVGVKIVSLADNTTVFEYPLANFGSSLIVNGILTTSGTLGTNTIQKNAFAVYPNPTTGILNFTTQETVNVTVIDITGKVVHTAKNINNGQSINLSGLQKGMYIAQIKGAATSRTEKIIVQ